MQNIEFLFVHFPILSLSLFFKFRKSISLKQCMIIKNSFNFPATSSRNKILANLFLRVSSHLRPSQLQIILDKTD